MMLKSLLQQRQKKKEVPTKMIVEDTGQCWSLRLQDDGSLMYATFQNEVYSMQKMKDDYTYSYQQHKGLAFIVFYQQLLHTFTR